MTRRLFLLIPDIIHSKTVVRDLQQDGVARSHVHAISREDFPLAGLPPATWAQKHDTGYRLERFLWLANLCVFFLALVWFVVLVWLEQPLLSLVSAAIMLISFFAGNFFSSKYS